MKSTFLVVLTLVPSFHSVGQAIEAITYTIQQGDEPPTKQGRTVCSIFFKKNKHGELVTTSWRKNAERKRLKKSVAIEKERIKVVESWKAVNKGVFTLTDLGIDIATLRSRTSSFKLHFEIPENLTVRVDSFQFCQQYKMARSISMGGEIILVTVIYESGWTDEFVFDSNDIGTGSFNLNSYLLCYILLKDRVPAEIPGDDFFTRNKLADILLYYQSIVECEGYYYQEYTNKNKGTSSRDHRMMVGWDFVRYMEQRIRK